MGACYATKDTFEIDEAVVPFQLSEDWALISPTKLPVERVIPWKLRAVMSMAGCGAISAGNCSFRSTACSPNASNG
jgi:hypothetical protein